MCAIDSALPKGDTIEIQIEEDGTVTIRTAGISGEIHKTAEEFLKMTAEMLGAEIHTHQHRSGTVHIHTKHNHGITTRKG